jgi:hypothetical protein
MKLRNYILTLDHLNQQFIGFFFCFSCLIFFSQGGGFSVSPKKLRSMLLGLEKRHKKEEGEPPITIDLEVIHSKEVAQSEYRRNIKFFSQFN